MKAFVAGLVAALLIAIGAALALQQINKPADVAFTSANARVTHETHQN